MIRDELRSFEDFHEEAGSSSAFEATKTIPVVKYGLDCQGMNSGPVREPLLELSENDRDQVKHYLEQLEYEDYEYIENS